MLPYFARWMDALPDFAAFAAAPESRVIKLWEGLGYYSRARNTSPSGQGAWLHRTHLPQTPAEWQELPGVGPYTAAAVTSISFNAPVACVDGKCVRILARLTADATPFRDSATAAKVFTPLADALLDARECRRTQPGDDGPGATVCFRHNPLCLTVPCGLSAPQLKAVNPKLIHSSRQK